MAQPLITLRFLLFNKMIGIFIEKRQCDCRISGIMFQRSISSYLSKAWEQFPVVVLTGARQAGKTTLARHFLSAADYVTLDILASW